MDGGFVVIELEKPWRDPEGYGKRGREDAVVLKLVEAKLHVALGEFNL
jgi:hypothetical protein